MPGSTGVRWLVDGAGIATLTLDSPAGEGNALDGPLVGALCAAIEELRKASLKGIVLTSAKRFFSTGCDLRELAGLSAEGASQIHARLQQLTASLRRLETLGIPVVAALNGTALGAGFALALACHRRIAIAQGELGFPEVTLGLLPGAGAVVRSVRLLGVVEALQGPLLRGRSYLAREALEAGLVHEVVETQEELSLRARAWIHLNPISRQPWDADGYAIPGGNPGTAALSALLPAIPAKLRKRLRGAPFPAPRAILGAAVEGAQVDVETATAIESRSFMELVTGQVARNMMRASLDQGALKRGARRPKDFPATSFRRVAVLGAGMMGSGIAQVCAAAGIEVVLVDETMQRAEAGRDLARAGFEADRKAGKRSPEQVAIAGARIHPTASVPDCSDCDLIIEAVFEDQALKEAILAEVASLAPQALLLASNTSTIPISRLATAIPRPEAFIGLHFFSPVEKMALLEIVVGALTSDASIARAFDFARQLEKIPILVNDGRGFFTSRIVGTYLDEAMGMLTEHVPAATIEQAGAQAGYASTPFQVLDALTLTLPQRIRREAEAGAKAEGRFLPPSFSTEVLEVLVDAHGRRGRSSGAGFYDYIGGRRARLWPGLAKHFDAKVDAVPFADVKDRMLFIEALEAVKCLEEGIIRSVAEANVGSLLGIGFPLWTGGVIQFIHGYHGGIEGFVNRAHQLAARYGERFRPPESLRSAAATGKSIAAPHHLSPPFP